MDRFSVIKTLGYQINYIWEHEYLQTRKKKNHTSLSEVVRHFHEKDLNYAGFRNECNSINSDFFVKMLGMR